MNSQNIEIGSYVLSTKGRDCNQVSIVYNIIENDYVLLIDGKGKKLLKPKKKNLKHLKNLGVVNCKIAEKIKTGKKIFDAEIYSAIRKAELNIE